MSKNEGIKTLASILASIVIAKKLTSSGSASARRSTPRHSYSAHRGTS